jgi:hypothetical protein
VAVEEGDVDNKAMGPGGCEMGGGGWVGGLGGWALGLEGRRVYPLSHQVGFGIEVLALWQVWG